MRLDIGLKDYRKSGANPNDLERIRFPVGTALGGAFASIDAHSFGRGGIGIFLMPMA
jgi:hypothetical protein